MNTMRKFDFNSVRLIFASMFIIVLALTESIQAQPLERFSEEIERFPSEIHIVVRTQLSKDDEHLMIKLMQFWSTSILSDTLKKQVINASNLLLVRTSGNATPFITLTRILLCLYDYPRALSQFDMWIRGLSHYTQNEAISIQWLGQFLENSFTLFTKNIIKTNPAFYWKASSGDFRYRFDNELTITYENTNLICLNEKDSMVILSTTGYFNPLTNVWKGKDGKVTWVRSQFPDDEIFATLSSYQIDLTKNEYSADSVWFTNYDYFRAPSLGRLKDKLIKSTRPENVAFPEFHTYHRRHKIRNLFDGVDFDGGYYMMGTQFVGSGTLEEPAIIEIRRKGKDFLRVEAKTYVFHRQSLTSNYAKIRFRIEEDSLFHTGLGFAYNDLTRTLSISPTDFLTTQSPLQDTYHNFSITFGQISWVLGSDELVFGPATGSIVGRALFESYNFFNEDGFDAIMGRDDQHPLLAIANFTKRNQSKVFYADEFASFMRKQVEQTRIVLMQMAMKGYIYYEYESGKVQPLKKLYDAIRARGRTIDYDLLRFASTTERTPNAILNLNTLDMEVKGVDNVYVSETQNVFIYPLNNELVLKKNRDFAFDGTVKAGLFTFRGKDFYFSYDNFSFELNSIDYLNLDYQKTTLDMYGKRELESVTSSLENITGQIFIDKPDNKSGLAQNPGFPIFKSVKNSYVYYDDKSIFNGVYNRENFFFEVLPFTFYNINNFEYTDMNFIGMFYSADIIGPIKDTLVLRPDNSLGFRRESPPQGYALYKGRGKFYNYIDLSNKGFRGEGDFTYITSLTKSEDFYFFPDSLSTQSKEFTINKQETGIQYPHVYGNVHAIKWLPYKEILTAFQGKEPFKMFENQARLAGNLELTPIGLTGNGLMEMEKARLRSSLFSYNAMDYNTNRASVEFNVVGTDSIAFSSKELKAMVDFRNGQGEFQKINESIFATMFPLMYESHLDKFHWSMQKNELTLSTTSTQQAVEMGKFHVPRMVDKDTIPAGSLLYTTWHGEDSLYFFTPKARYNLRNPNIKADSVKYIIVADAIINPHQQKLEVDARRRIVPLVKSTIIANYNNRTHRIYDAEITIPSRKKYFAKGIIDYVDDKDSIQKVRLNEISVDNQGNTFAKTTLTEPDRFKLSSHFSFVGDVELNAHEKYWQFDGGALPIHSCQQVKSSNVKFTARINPDSIYIPIPLQPINLNRVNLISGSVVTVDSIHAYPSFLSGRKTYSDKTLITNEGFLHFCNKRNRFYIGSLPKINNPDTTGNLISLSKDFCMIFGDGTINFPVNLGQIKNTAHGSLVHNLNDSLLTLDIVLSLDFFFNQTALEVMANDIASSTSLPGVDLSRKVFHKTLYERSTAREADAAINQIKLFGGMSMIPSGFQNTITFSDVRMKWDQSIQSFVSVGKIGIFTIGNMQVNKRVDGVIEINKRNTGDRVMFYLELAPEKYYVFYYVRGSMQVSSHNPAFTEPISAMKSGDRSQKVKPGQIPYNYVVGTKRELQRMQERYKQLLGKSSGIEDFDFEDEESYQIEAGAQEQDETTENSSEKKDEDSKE